MLKFFIYLTDVLTEDYGPYCYIPGTHNETHNRRLLDNIKPSTWDITDLNTTKFLAKKGTLIVSFQHGIHRGWPQSENHRRVMFVGKAYLDGREKQEIKS